MLAVLMSLIAWVQTRNSTKFTIIKNDIFWYKNISRFASTVERNISKQWCMTQKLRRLSLQSGTDCNNLCNILNLSYLAHKLSFNCKKIPILFERIRFALIRCEMCSLSYLKPWINPDSLFNAASGWYILTSYSSSIISWLNSTVDQDVS